jgi:predicted small secreted protein
MDITKFAKLPLIMLTICLLSACSNTLEGLGRDIENAGETIQETF